MYWNYSPTVQIVDLSQTATAFSLGGSALAGNSATVVQL
jgi:hypothetical protein